MKKFIILMLFGFLGVIPAWAYDLSGIITGGVTVGSITVSLTGVASKAMLTAADGSFKFTGLGAGTYTIIPEQSGLKFTPGSITRTITNADITDVNFIAAKRTPSLSIISPSPGEQIKSNGTVTAKFEVQDFSITATGDEEARGMVAEGSIAVVLWKETLVGSVTKQEPWMGFFWNNTEYTFNNLTSGTYTIDLQLVDMFHVRIPAKAKVSFGFDLKDWKINPVTDFSAQSNNDSIRLKWKNPPVGCLKGVLILRGTSTITAAPATGTTYIVGNQIGNATVVYNATATSYNTWQETIVDNYQPLPLNTTYYYSIFCYKDQGTQTAFPEYSPPTSNSVVLSNIAPSQVSDLDSKYKWQGVWYAMDPTDHSIILNWTAPGGDGTQGVAGSYTIKYSTSTITEGNFDLCLTVPGIIPTPSEAGGREHMVVIDNEDTKRPFGSRTIQPETQYYFALKASDGVSSSQMSNLFPTVGVSKASGITKDMTSPGTITDLSIVNPTNNSLMLVWTAPGDDGTFTWYNDTSGRADKYDIRYSTATLTEVNWAYAKSVPNQPLPSVAGEAQVVVISGLSLNTEEYYFGMKTLDEASNFSGLSNIVSVDKLSPGTITDLTVGTASASTLELSWTASGDNGSRGTVTAYDIRYYSALITEANWNSCTEVFGEPAPLSAGKAQTFTVTGLKFNTRYYLAMKAIDDAGNLSPLSNCPYGITTGTFPAPPGNLGAIAMDSQLILSWGATNVPDVGGYLIYYGTVSCAGTSNKQAYNQPIDAGQSCTYTLTGLDNGTKYYISIRAYNTNQYPSDYSMEITGEPLGMGYQFLPQSVIIPMGGQQAETGSPLELDQLRNAYKAIFTHVKNGGGVAWTASNALPYDGKNYMRGTFISEFSTGSGTTFSTQTAVGTLTGFDVVVSEPGVGMGKVLGVTKSYGLKPIKIALFYSVVKDTYGQPICWEEGYFERLFRMYLWDAQEFTVIDEIGIKGGALGNYDMVIFPAVKRGYMADIKGSLTATGLTNIRTFVENGGFLYSQGESNYIAEMAGLVGTGTVDLTNRVSISDSIGQLRIEDESSPVVFARLSEKMYVLDDPMLKAMSGQSTVAIYTNAGNSPAIVVAERNRGKVILMGGHPSDKREYYPLALNPVLWAMSQKAALACDGEQKFNENVEKDVIPGLEPDVPVNVSISFSNFWDTKLQSVEVISEIPKGFKITDNSNITPIPTSQVVTDGTTTLTWTFPEVFQGRLSFSYTVFTEADALKKGETVVCQTKAIYTEGGNHVTVHALPVQMRAMMAARLVGDRALEKQSVYGVSGAGVHFDVKFPIENKEDTEARKVYIQDLVALVSPAIDPTNYRRIPSAVWNTNNGNNHSIWVTNEAYFFKDNKYPLPDEAHGIITMRFNINNWDGKTTYVFEQPKGNDSDIVIPEKYKAPVWGPGHNVPLMQKTETGDLILPAYKLTWTKLSNGTGTDQNIIQGYDYREPAIRYGIRAIELPPDGVEYPRTILMKTLPNIPDTYVVNGKVIMDAPALGFMILLGGDPIPYRELLASSGAYVPRVTDPADFPMLTYQDIWNRPHTATLRTMDPQMAKVSDFFPTVKLHPEVNDTFELFEDLNNNDFRDTGEKLFLEYDITKKAKLHLMIKTGNISTEFPDVVKPAAKYDLSRDQNVITCSIFKGLGYSLKYTGHWDCPDLQKIGNPTQPVKEFDTDMFHVLQFQQRLDAGKREQINVYATMTTYPDVHREGFMKVNDGTEYVYHTPKAGPNQYQIFNAHVQGIFAIGNNVEVTKKVAPVNIGNYGDTIYHIIKVEDPYEPRQFEMDPYLRSYGFGGLASTIFVGGRENDKLYNSRLHSGESTIVRIEVCNNLGEFGGKAYHLENVAITPDMATVPSWMTITQDVAMNTIPPIHGDLVYLLASQKENPAIYESWKGVIYFKVTTNNIPTEAKGKVWPIKFNLTCTDPDDKLKNFCNLKENTTGTVIPEAWIGVYDDQGKITTTYGKANIMTLKDGFPDFVKVKEAKLMTEGEKETFIGKMGWDVDQYPRGTSSTAYFDDLGINRDIKFNQNVPNVVFDMSSIIDPKATATTVPWTYDGIETKAFFVVVKSDTAVTNSGMKLVNTGANIAYTDHFSNTGTAASTSQNVVAHGPRVESGYILDGVRRGFNQVLTKELIMGEKNDVELRVTLSNEGDNIAEAAKGSVTLGTGVTFATSSVSPSRMNGNTVVWDDLGNIAPGAVKEVKMTVSITPPAGTSSGAPMLKPAPKKWTKAAPPSVRAAAPVQYTLINTTGIKFKDAFTGVEVTPPPIGSLTIMAAPPLLSASITLNAVGNPGSITLSWNAITAAKGYNVYRSDNPAAGTFTHIGMTGILTGYIDKTMDEDIPYYYVVTAFDGAEESQVSGTATATPGDIWPPGVVILGCTAKTGNSVTLLWTSPGDNGNKGTATLYDLRRSVSNTDGFDSYTSCAGEPLPMQAGSGQPMNVTDLLPNTTYYFYIKSQDGAGNWSPLSNKLQVTTNAAPTISTTTQLFSGWNLYALPLKPSTSYTSQTLGKAINDQGGQCTIVQSWSGGAWKTRRIDINIGDLFNIDIGKGYFVYCTTQKGFTVQGVAVKTQQLKLVPGWNLIGLSVGTMSGRLLGLPSIGTISGKLLGADILSQNGTCTTIQSWQGGQWKTLRVDLGIGDEFDIESGRGYFAYCNEGSGYSPNRITLSNVGSNTAVISYATWDKVSSWLRYGTTAASLSSLVYDVRGEGSETTKHYISLTNLAASTTYYYDIVTSGSTDDNNSEHYSFKTGAAINPVAARMVSGQVSKKGGGQVEDAIVYVRLKDTNANGDSGASGWVSTRTNSSGNFSIDLNAIRRGDGIGLFSYSQLGGDTIEVVVDGSGDGRGKKPFDTSTSTSLDVVIE